MELAAFMARRRADSHRPCSHTQTLLTTVLACVLSGLLAGCLTDQHATDGTPRDLLPDTSVQGDQIAGTNKASLALLLPLSGPNADIGQQLWDAAVLALFDSGRDDVVLLPYDTQGTPTAAAAAEAAVKRGADAVVGPLFSSSVSSAKPILAASGTRGIALSNNRAVAGLPFFLIGNDPEAQVDALASHLAASGRSRVLLFGPDTRYLQLLRDRLWLLEKAGKATLVEARLYRNSATYTDIAKEVRAITLYDQRAAALKEFTAIFTRSWQLYEDPEEALQSALERLSERLEATRLHLASFPSEIKTDRNSWVVTESEYGDALSELLQLYQKQLTAKKAPQEAMHEAVTEFERRETLGQVDFDAVLLPIGGKPLLVIAPMFEYFNASPPNVWLVGTDVWEAAARQSPKDLQGGFYVTATSRGWESFQTRFEATFGYKPDLLASTVYDAVGVAMTEKQANGQLSFVESFITRQMGFDGVNGRFRFLPSGTNQRTLEIVEVRKDGAASIATWNPDPKPEELHTPAPADAGKVAPVAPVQGPPRTIPPVSSLEGSRKGDS